MDDYLPVAVPGREAGGRCFAGLLYRPVPAIRIAGEAGGNRSGPFACQTADEPLADRTGRGGDGDPSLQQRAIIAGLIRKIERRHAPTSRFQFTEGMSYAEKYVKVQEWWNTGRFHLAMAFKSPTELNYFLWRFPVGWNDGPVGTCS